VLVVEDDEDLAGVLRETFERQGVAADVAPTGEAAWLSARRRRPDAVVLDIAMPEGDGYWVAERFRDHETLRTVPIVAYTALDLGEAGRERLRRLDVEILTKSRIEPAELERRVLALLSPADGRRHVLLVEDDADLAGVLRETFERRGVAADVASTGEGAWAAARLRRPDVVVLDISMPEGDGYWVAERFRGHDTLRTVPIVAYTALDLDEAGRERLRRLDVEVLTKSRIEPAELERRILALITPAEGGRTPG
jgi:DNA-binding response OmpR family regulator